ncbi:uncharacterized protein LOC143190894 isoform X1 [Rhynchophorus ferrugineus]|uniref:uncharacterized protein LOC143190894 isoform X1 n=1 Tax=Rhynchophorus ferrugineus TaxID=354439 RepID=UPI003FCE184F
MNEFLKLNWRIKNLSDLEPQDSFIDDEIVGDSLIFKFCQRQQVFKPTTKKKHIFDKEQYIPGSNFKPYTVTKSLLDTFAHEQCLKALKICQSGKNSQYFNTVEQFAVDMYQKLKPKIIEENSKYQTFVLQQWNTTDRKKFENIRGKIYLYGRSIWERKMKEIYSYPQYFKEVKVFSMAFSEQEYSVEFNKIGNVLNKGILAKFSKPTLKSPCFLKSKTLPPSENDQVNFSKLPVSQDKNIDNILQNHDIDLIISASGLKCLSDNSNLKAKWLIPISVKTITIQKEDGTTFKKKVTFIDKPFIQSSISNLDITYKSFKRLVKTNFCQLEAFKFNEDEPHLRSEDLNNKNDICDDSDMDMQTNKILHNVNYQIWKIKKNDGQSSLMKNKSKTVEFNVLIRSKLDACECNEQGSLQPVILKPKLETQLNYGAKIPSKSELAREWTSLFFIPFSNLYRVRLSPLSGEVIAVDKCNIQKVVAEANTHYNYKPQHALGILQIVFEELINLDTGNYLLQHLPKHEVFVAILKEDQSSSTNSNGLYNFHAEHEKIKLEPLPQQWLPVDVNYVLPSFDITTRLPGMFTPRSKAMKKKKKNTKKKTKVKTTT